MKQRPLKVSFCHFSTPIAHVESFLLKPPLKGVAQQFQSGNKLPYMEWVIPNAPENRDAMAQAWYTPSQLSPFASSRPELDDPEDEDGLKRSVKYVVSLIDDLVEKGIPAERIVVGGFSQGCAMSLLVGLTSKYAGKLAGVMGIGGYLPIADQIAEMREEAGLPKEVGDLNILFTRGTKDILVPKRYFKQCHERLVELGANQDCMTLQEFEGLGHSLSAMVMRNMCEWLEKILPPVEGSS